MTELMFHWYDSFVIQVLGNAGSCSVKTNPLDLQVGALNWNLYYPVCSRVARAF